MTLKPIPSFWIITRPGRYFMHSDMNKLANIFREEGFEIYGATPSNRCSTLSQARGHLIIRHEDEGAMLLFVLKYNDVLRDFDVVVRPYTHNTKIYGSQAMRQVAYDSDV